MGCWKLDNIGIIIQCRDSSERYKEKSVRPFYKGKSILQIIIDKLTHLPYPIILATTPSSPIATTIGRMSGLNIVVCPEGDVLAQFYKIVKDYKLDGIVRICADNPFVQLPLMAAVLMWKGYDYVAFKDAMRRHEGFFVEYISGYAIKEAGRLCTSPYERRHVTPFIYNHQMDYSIKWLPIPEELDRFSIRLTVDTKEDFELAQRVYEQIEEKHWYYIVDYLYYRPHLIRKMEENIRRNLK